LQDVPSELQLHLPGGGHLLAQQDVQSPERISERIFSCGVFCCTSSFFFNCGILDFISASSFLVLRWKKYISRFGWSGITTLPCRYFSANHFAIAGFCMLARRTTTPIMWLWWIHFAKAHIIFTIIYATRRALTTADICAYFQRMCFVLGSLVSFQLLVSFFHFFIFLSIWLLGGSP